MKITPVRFLWGDGMKPDEIHYRLLTLYRSGNRMTQRKVCEWAERSEAEQMNVTDEPRSPAKLQRTSSCNGHYIGGNATTAVWTFFSIPRTTVIWRHANFGSQKMLYAVVDSPLIIRLRKWRRSRFGSGRKGSFLRWMKKLLSWEDTRSAPTCRRTVEKWHNSFPHSYRY